MEHQWGTRNLWNLFPHNMLGIIKYLLLNKYSGLCCLDALEACLIELLNMKCMEKGSTGSSLYSQLTLREGRTMTAP